MIAFLFAALFFGIWTSWKALRYLLWLSSAFLLFGLGLLSQILLIPRNLGINAVVTAVLYTAATLTFAEGALRRLGLRSSYLFNFTVSLFVVAGIAYYFYEVPWLDGRVYVLNFGLATLLLVTALRMRRGAHQPLDRALFWTLLIFSLQFFPRTLLTFQHLNETRDIAVVRQYVQTPFWIWMNLSFLIFIVLIGLLFSVSIGADIVAALNQKATTDSLTGLLNRRGFEELAERMTAKAKEKTQSLILFDIDDFKSINDLYGHHGGDAVLAQIGSLLQELVHEAAAAVAARFGGEEFSVLLSGLSQCQLYRIADGLREDISSTEFGEGSLNERTVTASFGVVEINEGESLEQGLRRADDLLYAAKRAGKNRIVADWI